mmetsp:Transcript_28510/g.39694  ORF Transcript_28510/g.39694 Transcript_28510/m.39694 type:complete len:413 (-) Transcript_28510:398-1636(-)
MLNRQNIACIVFSICEAIICMMQLSHSELVSQAKKNLLWLLFAALLQFSMQNLIFIVSVPWQLYLFNTDTISFLVCIMGIYIFYMLKVTNSLLRKQAPPAFLKDQFYSITFISAVHIISFTLALVTGNRKIVTIRFIGAALLAVYLGYSAAKISSSMHSYLVKIHHKMFAEDVTTARKVRERPILKINPVLQVIDSIEKNSQDFQKEVHSVIGERAYSGSEKPRSGNSTQRTLRHSELDSKSAIVREPEADNSGRAFSDIESEIQKNNRDTNSKVSRAQLGEAENVVCCVALLLKQEQIQGDNDKEKMRREAKLIRNKLVFYVRVLHFMNTIVFIVGVGCGIYFAMAGTEANNDVSYKESFNEEYRSRPTVIAIYLSVQCLLFWMHYWAWSPIPWALKDFRSPCSSSCIGPL